jgi:hypothetical protein
MQLGPQKHSKIPAQFKTPWQLPPFAPSTLVGSHEAHSGDYDGTTPLTNHPTQQQKEREGGGFAGDAVPWGLFP